MRWMRMFQRSRVEDDLTDEVAHYLEMAAAEYVRSGLARDEAMRRARMDFGGVESAKESVRSYGLSGALDTLRRDVAYALRGLRRSPSFAIVAVLTLALGIGANAAMFSVVNAVMLRPLPYREPDRLALIYTDDVRRGLHREGLAYRTIEEFRRSARGFEDIGIFNTQRAVVIDGTNRERTRNSFVSGNLFNILGVPVARGRSLVPADEEQALDVATVSHTLAVRRFGSDSAAIGQTVVIETNGRSMSLRVVGVMPAGFYFPDKLVEIWMPATKYWRFNREHVEYFPDWARRWTAIARIKPGVSVQGAASDLATIGRRLDVALPSTFPDFPGFATSVVPVLDNIADHTLQTSLWILLGAVALVLLVACANVANLLLARGATRQREFGVRRALGASRARLVRQLLAESMVLAAAGGALGVLLAVLCTRLLAVIAAKSLPRIDELSIDGRVLSFAIVVSIVSGIVFGIVPALRVAGDEAFASLKETAQPSASRGLRRMRGMLVVAECSLAIVLLTGAGLLLRSLSRLNSVDPGFDPRHVLSVRIEFPPEGRLSNDEQRMGSTTGPIRARNWAARANALATRIASSSGVESVGYIDDMFIASQGHASITIPGRANDVVAGELNEGDISPEFLTTLHVPVLRGRGLTEADLQTKINALWHPVVTDRTLAEKEAAALPEPVVVNAAFVKRFFPGEEPIGKRFCTDPTNKTYWYVIVGVIGDMHRQGLDRDAIPEFYGPHLAAPTARADILVRTTGDPLGIAPQLRRTIADVMPGAIVVTMTTAERQLGDFAAERSFHTWLLSLFAALALALAAIGIYGVVHYAVAERTREIGLRVALGASPDAVVGFIIRQGMAMPLLGIVLGMLAALGATRLVSHLLFGIGAADPLTFAGVLAALALVSLAACYLPARRAAAVDPLTALRSD